MPHLTEPTACTASMTGRLAWRAGAAVTKELHRYDLRPHWRQHSAAQAANTMPCPSHACDQPTCRPQPAWLRPELPNLQPCGRQASRGPHIEGGLGKLGHSDHKSPSSGSLPVGLPIAALVGIRVPIRLHLCGSGSQQGSYGFPVLGGCSLHLLKADHPAGTCSFRRLRGPLWGVSAERGQVREWAELHAQGCMRSWRSSFLCTRACARSEGCLCCYLIVHGAAQCTAVLP